jgi:glycerate kinase
VRVLVAPDKFKGTLTAPEAAAALAAGVLRVLPSADVRLLPVADGGEGTVSAVLEAGGSRRTADVQGPLGEPLTVDWAELDGRAVIEVAAASGLQHVRPDDATAVTADTYGTGQLIGQALDAGLRRVVLGLGGSASTDGGTGILRALGARFLDAAGDPLPPGGGSLARLAAVDLIGLDSRLAQTSVTLCCDVRSPLLGPAGASAVFAPQKGASAATVPKLEEGLARLADILRAATGRDATALDWGGAAGGCAGGLYAGLGAAFMPGFDLLADLIGLDRHLAWTDLVVVGEGSLDAQSLAGKAPVSLARRAARHGIPVLAVAGRVDVSTTALRDAGIMAATGAADVAGSVEAALAEPACWAEAAAEQVLTAWAGGSAAGPRAVGPEAAGHEPRPRQGPRL